MLLIELDAQRLKSKTILRQTETKNISSHICSLSKPPNILIRRGFLLKCMIDRTSSPLALT